MTKKKFNEEKIMKVLQEEEGDITVRDVCRKHQITEQIFYRCRNKFGSMAVLEVRRLKELNPTRHREQMDAFREEFEELLHQADINRLAVLVDDLDRCMPETAIETLEAIRLFLFVPKSAFVIAANEDMIEYAVRQHFPDMPVATGSATYARNYLEKLIQVPFRLPSLGYTETHIHITLLLVPNESERIRTSLWNWLNSLDRCCNDRGRVLDLIAKG